MAWVYRAWDLALHRPVALKVLYPQYAADPRFLERFRREARLAASVSSHPNVVHVYDVGQEGETHFLVMELVEGETLKDRIRREGQLDVAAAFAVGRQVTSALEYAHQHGLVHRDVKPQNILIGSDGSVKVVDFGIAAAEAATPLTAPGWLLGSIPYVSPEQLEGAVASPASDLYALGVVLYEMLTGRLPFTADHPAAMLAQQQKGLVPAINAVNAAVPLSAAAVVMRALERDPSRRYRDAAAMREALTAPEALVERTAVAPLPLPSPEPAREAVRGSHASRLAHAAPDRRRDPVLPWLGALTILVVGGTAFGVLLPRGSGHGRVGTSALPSRATVTRVPALVTAPSPTATAGPTATLPPPVPTSTPPPSPTPTPPPTATAMPLLPVPTPPPPPTAPAPTPAVLQQPGQGVGPNKLGKGPKPGKGPEFKPFPGHGKGHDKGHGGGDD